MRTCALKSAVPITLLLSILFTAICSAYSASPSSVPIGNSDTPVYLGKELQYYIADRQNITITDILKKEHNVQWKQSNQKTLFLGSRSQYVWVRFKLTPSPDVVENWVLEITWPFYDQLELYAVDKKDGRITKTEMSLPLPSYLPYAFNLSMHQDMEKEVYLKLHNIAPLLLPLRLVPASVFVGHTLVRHILLGVLFGTLVVMCLYNTFLSIFTRDSSYTYYVVYVFAIILYTLDNSGLGQTYLWSGNDYIESHSYGLFSSFSFLAAALFIRRFLNLPGHGGWLLHLSNIAAVYWIVMLVLYLFSTHHWILNSENYGAFFSCIAGLIPPVTLWIRGSISAKYLTIAWTILILSTALLMTGLTGIIPFTPIVQNSQNAGFIIEVVLLSLALAEQINRTRKAKETAQKKILTMEREANILLEKRVAQRTIDLKRAMNTLELANKELGTLSLQDELTQIANRRHFNMVFEQEYKRAVRNNQPLSVIFVDIDHFKKLNDNLGHQVGDLCLQHIAQILRSQAARAEDFIARFGGEEFVIILPGTPIKTAIKTAERMRNKIGSQPIHIGGKDHSITASFGVAALPSKNYDNQSSLLRGADKALYKAKTNGRNRTEVDQFFPAVVHSKASQYAHR